jgi:DNA-binding transcriptional regulator YiaG
MKSDSAEARRLAQMIERERTRSGSLPPNVREVATAFARRRSEAGVSQEAIADELGLSTMTVHRWLSSRLLAVPSAARESETPTAAARNKPPRLRPVHVVCSKSRGASSKSVLVVISPAGFRVEGLVLADLLTLLRGVG